MAIRFVNPSQFRRSHFIINVIYSHTRKAEAEMENEQGTRCGCVCVCGGRTQIRCLFDIVYIVRAVKRARAKREYGGGVKRRRNVGSYYFACVS